MFSGDSAAPGNVQKLSDLCRRIDDIIACRLPASIVLDDPAGNSHVQVSRPHPAHRPPARPYPCNQLLPAFHSCMPKSLTEVGQGCQRRPWRPYRFCAAGARCCGLGLSQRWRARVCSVDGAGRAAWRAGDRDSQSQTAPPASPAMLTGICLGR